MGWQVGHTSSQGEANAFSRLTDADVREIRRLRANLNGRRLHGDASRSLMSVAKRFNVSKALVSAICNGKAWKHVDEENKA